MTEGGRGQQRCNWFHPTRPSKPIQEVHSPSTNLLCHPSPQARIPQNLEAQFTNFSPPIDVAGSKLQPGWSALWLLLPGQRAT